ncbi:hypothetical protein ACFOWM_06095 [Ferruginibacter yonginensis]|uniref:Uncharacterized protein n=1 Tax=Ferruginibacter yonginensis TaxID=1310416 RepID=A0ABV8QQ81_9BACT
MENTVNKTIDSVKNSPNQLANNTHKKEGGDSFNSKDPHKTSLVYKTAELMKCDISLVYKVLAGERKNDQVFACYMELKHGETLLMKAVKELIPFDL